MFAARTKVLKALASDPLWSKKLEAAKTREQFFEVVEAYCREKGLKIKHVEVEDAEKK